MPESIFISHAGPDSARALEVAKELETNGLKVEIDREQLRQGDRFLKFMEEALSECDYCLLLWSEAASKGKWVAVEWEAALYRAVEESRRFLLIGRLDAQPLPALLGPRLRVDLFPKLYPGLTELLALWQEDVAAAEASGRPVARAKVSVTEDHAGATVYLTSELFGITQPLRLDLAVPAGIHLDRVVADLGLPKQLDSHGVMGVSYEYRLVHDDRPIHRAKSLAAQGVREGDVLWLEVEMTPFAKGKPVGGQLGRALFRGAPLDGEVDDVVALARRWLLKALTQIGLGV
ncbi:MAG TPA: TIR domain-containing protein [Thermoanaerobaculia bacterium]|nr:TIR domain-containing protein [Thermoanaerobaculia bacterium]